MLNLHNAVVYDIETFPNCITLAAESLFNDQKAVWEISDRRDDRLALMDWFSYLAKTGTPMIGFNNLNFDYPVIHQLFTNPHSTYEQLYAKSQSIIQSNNSFGHMIWANDRFAPQIDLFKMHHFDNPAKSTSLKALQINMRSPSVVDSPIPWGTMLTPDMIDNGIVPYNVHDVSKTKDFAHFSMEAINFRNSLVNQFGVDVMNWNDTKIGEQMVIKKLGDDLCYDRTVRPRKTRQTPRFSIALRDIIFPYVQFEHPEFNRILAYLKEQTLKSEEIDAFSEERSAIITKGVFKDLKAHVGGIDFFFGVGGIHGSVERQNYISTENYIIQDIDVRGLYPDIAIKNRLSPAHLGEVFINIYSDLPKERKKWQDEKGKKCVEANALKLASNGVYGKSNSKFSPFYDPQFTMTITINGQLMLAMLAEQLIKVPTLKLIQVNTDGVTYCIHKDHVESAKLVWRWWEGVTLLTLEDAVYNRMFIRDVNSYIAEGVDGSTKLKGAYWTPDPLDYARSISECQPPAWHKNLGNAVSARAAVHAMTDNIDPELYIRSCTNPYDFMLSIKAKGAAKLYYGEEQIQKTSRYYVTTDGHYLRKIAFPTGPLGQYKRKNGVSDSDYQAIMKANNGEWDERVCTKNKSKYEMTDTQVVAGQKVGICNNVSDFDFSKIDHAWYLNEARKLMI